MASDPLFAMLSGSFAEGPGAWQSPAMHIKDLAVLECLRQQSEVPFDYSGEALPAWACP